MQPYHIQLDLAHGSQMYNDLVRSADTVFGEQERQKKFSSVAGFEAHREQVRAHFLDAIGGLPTEKCSLNAHVTSVLEEYLERD